MNKKTTTIIIAILIVLLGGYILYMINRAKYKSVSTQTQQSQLQHITKVDAKTGELVNGFPKELVFGSAKLTSSYSMSYSSADLFTTTYTTDQTISDAFKSYMDYLNKIGGYSIENQSLKPENNYASIYASSSSKDVAVQITKFKGATQVAISYEQKH